MRSIIRSAGICMLVLFGVAGTVRAETDKEGSKDHPLFNRMPGFYIHQYDEKEFDSHTFWVKDKETIVEGHLYSIMYSIQPGVKEPGRVQILRNYENAVKKIGGKVLSLTDDGDLYLMAAKDGKEFWVHVNAYVTSQYSVIIIEKAGMKQDITANAAVFANDIKATGRTAVYGIYFDTNKAEIKPTSEAALSEIAKLLTADPALKIYVVGHTDSIGDTGANMKLSQARAEAVIKALTNRFAVLVTRLKGYGVGPLAPVASNDTEEGRAKNRRVELVKQ